MADLVSVIVPVYNAESYLEPCVMSILAQTYHDLEVILVDDGSTDGSGAICDRYAAKDARVRVIHKENGGVSSARNAGLDAARGKYVSFVDSDDQPDFEMIDEMVDAIEKNEADMVTVDFRAISPTETKKRVMQISDCVQVTEKPDLLKSTRLLGGQNMPLSIFVRNNLYRMDLIRKCQLRFRDLTEVHSEDQLFNLCYALNVHKAVFIGRSLYTYTKRDNTLSHSLKPTALLNRRLTLIRVLRSFVREHALGKQSERFYTLRTWTFFTDGCAALGCSARILEGIVQISAQNRKELRKCLRHMLFCKVGSDYARAFGMDLHALVYFKFMLLLMLLGKYDRPVRTFLANGD